MAYALRIPFDYGTFFITITNFKWLPLFEITNGYEAVYHFFEALVAQGHLVHAFVIMPNHLHCIISFRNNGKSINQTIGNGKRFMAYDLIQRLKDQQKEDVLETLRNGVNQSDRGRNKIHEVFQPSFDWKICESGYFIQQKLDYIHFNPVRYKRSLAVRPEEYPHSSASFYFNSVPASFPVTHIKKIFDQNLSGYFKST